MPGGEHLNIYDVSKKAGVSIATVSRVINGNSNVSDKTRQKVLNVMTELGYTPNVFARGLGLDSMQTIGIIAVFVIANISKDEVAISARSKEGFNVQMVMEKMNGGGHMTAAGLQVKDKSINELENELHIAIEDYMKGEN